MVEARTLSNVAQAREGGREGGDVPVEKDTLGRLDADAGEEFWVGREDKEGREGGREGTYP